MEWSDVDLIISIINNNRMFKEICVLVTVIRDEMWNW